MTDQQPGNGDLERAALIFGEAIALQGSERAAYLDGACGDDATLRAEIESMLSAHDAQGSFLGHPSQDAAGMVTNISGANDPTVASISEQAGQTIGNYKLLQQLGEGGFGVVYMAEQEKPVRRRVALKIIKLGMDTKQVIARFEAERQALAMMDHPNIAKVLDAGATETGRPYFVMELVKGEAITTYCDRHNVSVEDRLALFQQTCNAVQHAHQKGIIHRDIKPSNVMITLHDGVPVPKVIDFGIAKATDHKLTEKTIFTEFRQFIGTPEYMSPEQAEMSGIDIDTRSDVYSLGVLLYELLTGVTPFDSQKLRSAAYGEIQRIIREETPSKPSTRLSTLDTLPSVAAHRHTEPRKLGLLIRGDLDWIVMKAMEKDRTRRYETANGFAADIQRYMDSEPVDASPPSVGYKLRKFIRRNKAGVTAASLIAAVLVLGVMGTTWGMIRAVDAERIASEERDEARLQTEITQAVNDFLNDDLLAAVAPSNEEGRGFDVSMRAVLDAASERIDEASRPGGRFADKPLVEAAIRATIGDTYNELNQYEAAREHGHRAAQLRSRELGSDDPATFDARETAALASLRLNDLTVAEQEWSSLVEDADRVFPEDNPTEFNRRVWPRMNLASVYINQDRVDEAVDLLQTAVEDSKRILGDEDRTTLWAARDLAWALLLQERFDEAVSIFRKALTIHRRQHGSDHPNTLRTTRDLTWSLLYLAGSLPEGPERRALYEESASMLREAFAAYDRVYGPDDPRSLSARKDLVWTYRRMGRLGDAIPLGTEVLADLHRVHGSDHAATIDAAAALGAVYFADGQYAEALPVYRELLAARRRVKGNTHYDTLWTMKRLADTCAALGLDDEARSLYREHFEHAIAVAEAPDASAQTLNDVAWDLLTHEIEAFRDPARALVLADRLCSSTEAAENGELWDYLDTLAKAQHMTGDTAAAIETQKRSLSLMPADSGSRADYEQRLREYENALQMELGGSS